ncbi:TerD family protein, partial [Streptomyces celluloflavus]
MAGHGLGCRLPGEQDPPPLIRGAPFPPPGDRDRARTGAPCRPAAPTAPAAPVAGDASGWSMEERLHNQVWGMFEDLART